MADITKACVPCLHPNAKSILREAYEEFPEVLEALQRMPDCSDGTIIDPCFAQQAARGRRAQRAKREPSAYQRFVGECLKGKNIKGFGQAGPAMKECALAWREQKGKQEAGG